MPHTVTELPVAFAVGYDQAAQKEIFNIVNYTPDELRNLVQFFVNKLSYQDAGTCPHAVSRGVMSADGITGDSLKGQAYGLKGKYV